MKTEYQVFWKRAGLRWKMKTFKTRKGADRYLEFFGPEPWKAFGKKPDDLICCNGHECNCMGATHREQSEAQRESMPALEFIGIRVRAVNEWVTEFCDDVRPGAPNGAKKLELEAKAGGYPF